jgi:TrmH family RNA methyltransferase
VDIAALDKIHIVLIETSHPGNIGAAARAMKNMGLSKLRLVRPKQFPCAEATARASGADDILANAQVYDQFEESLQDCHLILGTSARPRSIAWQMLTPRGCAEQAIQTAGNVALVFGREHSGLTNEELDRCHYWVQIPTNPAFSSLNLAAAVQVLSYELRGVVENTLSTVPLSEPPASTEAMLQFYAHLEQTLINLEFLDPEKPRRLMRRLHRLFNRAQPNDSELNILRGILSAAEGKYIAKHAPYKTAVETQTHLSEDDVE